MAEPVLNSRLGPTRAGTVTEEPVRFHRRLPGYQPTPLRTLPHVADELGLAQVLIKDESSRLGLTSFKALGVSWAVERALGAREKVTELIAASAGNHGLAVAHTAAARGLGCRIFLPAGAAMARAERIAATGAQLVLVHGDYDKAVAVAAGAAERTGDATLIADVSADPAAETPRWVVEGYSTLFAELDGQLAEPVDALLVPAGVGSLAAAAAVWAASRRNAPQVLAVEPLTAACVGAALAAGRPVRIPTPGTTMSGLDCGTASAVAWPVLRDGLTGAVPVADPPVHRAMRELAAQGMAIGDCGAAPLAALRELMTQARHDRFRALAGLRPGARVLLLATEGVTDPDSYRSIVG